MLFCIFYYLMFKPLLWQDQYLPLESKAQPLFCSLNFLFSDVVPVTVVVFLNSLIMAKTTTL